MPSPTVTNITVTKCDNELYIIAIPATVGLGSFEILHMSSGFNDPVSYTVKLSSILPKGDYILCFLGINWGGPEAFTVSFPASTIPPWTVSNPTAPVGCICHTVAIHV